MTALTKTYLQIVNEVLGHLRESSVSTVSETEYSTLIGYFVDLAVQEISGAWEWGHSRKYYTDYATTGNSLVNISDEINSTARAYNRSIDLTVIQQVWNITSKTRMTQRPWVWIQEQEAIGDSQTGSPIFYCPKIMSNELKLKLFPVPDANYQLGILAYTPHANFTSDSQSPAIPWKLIVMLTYIYALRERGEDDGANFLQVLQQYNTALGAAIAADSTRNMDDLLWRVD